MKSQTIGQSLMADAKRMAWIYPSAIVVAVGLMAAQTASGIKIFNFNPPQSAPAAPIYQPIPDIKPEDIKQISNEIVVSQRLIEDLSKQLADTKSQLAAVLRQNESIQSKVSALVIDKSRLDDNERRLASVEKSVFWYSPLDEADWKAQDWKGMKYVPFVGLHKSAPLIPTDSWPSNFWGGEAQATDPRVLRLENARLRLEVESLQERLKKDDPASTMILLKKQQ
jgi:regulator of replication initiation timing